MAFNFPASPTTGTISNGYVFDGIGWAGGPGVSGPVTEQFFDLSGKTELIIDVPSWAKVAVFEGALWPGSTVNYTLMSVSTDGVAFYGNVHQLVGGPYHKTTGGYLTQTAVAATGFYLSMPSSNLNVPHFFNATVNLETGLSNQIISFRSEFSNFDNTAQGQQYVWQGYLNAAPSPSPGRAKKLRIFAQASTAFAAASYIKVRWLGDSNAIPQSNAIADAPSDGAWYLRQSGAWLKTSTMPYLQATRRGGNQVMAVGNHGIYNNGNSIIINQGGWTTGAVSGVSGFDLIVPRTGLYWINNRVYYQPAGGTGRVEIMRNGAGLGVWTSPVSTTVDGVYECTTLAGLTVGDRLAYSIQIAPVGAYHDIAHTEVKAVMIGA